MSLFDRFKALGVSQLRLDALGMRAPARNDEPRADGINPPAVQRAASRARTREAVDQAVADIGAWRAYRDAADPVTRARLGMRNRAAIDRGRELDVEVEEETVTAANVGEAAGRALDMINALRGRNEPPPDAA